jgi:deazaflavin-dependent oxidoreductase (nitroreductase family)
VAAIVMNRVAQRIEERADALKRALYRGGRPGTLMRALNRLDAMTYARGLLAPRAGATLEVIGRRSGQPVSLPVAVVQLDGSRFLVSMLGRDANWVRNAHAANGRAVLRRRGREQVVLREIPVAERPPVLRHYLAIAPGARPHFPVDWRAPMADFVPIADRYPVFRIDTVAVPLVVRAPRLDHSAGRSGAASSARISSRNLEWR